jgi:isoleucyl-tRNA synthetase
MNVRTVEVTSNEEAYGVNYVLHPDAKALGTKFKKDATKIKAALPTVTKSQIKEFLATDAIQIAGFELTSAELSVVRMFDDSHPSYQANFTNEVLVILDTELDQSLIQEGLARELVNRVQRLRKKAGLLPTDDVLYYYSLTLDENGQLRNMLDGQKDLLNKYLKQEVLEKEASGNNIIFEEEQEINGSKFMLSLAK